MKRILLIMLTLMLTSFTFGSETGDVAKNVVDKTSNGIEQVYNDTKVMAIKLEKVLTQLAEGLKVTSKEVWQILVRQQKVYAWATLIALIISLLSWIHFYYRFKVYKRDLTEKGKPKQANGLVAIITFLSALVMSILVSIHFLDMMTGFFNPEYGAMVHIIEVAKTIK